MEWLTEDLIVSGRQFQMLDALPRKKFRPGLKKWNLNILVVT